MNFEDLDNIEYQRIEDTHIEWLLSTLEKCSLSPEIKEALESELMTMDITPERAWEIKQKIEEAEVCPIQAGYNYSQTEIKNKLKKEIL